MLRPATPLTILLFAAFVLLILSVISTPVVKQIPLASYGGVDFGVFGFCQSTGCSPFEVGYDTAKLFNAEQTASFDLPVSVRSTLSYILIVHPVAAFFTLVMTVLAGSAHTHKASHSPRFLLGIFILSLITLILSLLAFLIDVLLFVPHMAWGSYLVLAATVLIIASSIVSCAMRRTLVGRKARKRRIAENAEMNGENYYARQGAEPTAPAVNNTMAITTEEKPSFATFDSAKKDEERTSDERIPLTARTPTGTSPSNMTVGMAGGPNERYGGPNPPRDQYGNPMPSGAFVNRSRDSSTDPSLNRQYSDNSMNSRGGRGMPYRGRGGYGPPNGRGGYGPPPGGRGGYRGGYGGPNSRGGYGPPGPSRGPPDGMMAGAMMRGGRGGAPPPGYGRGGYNDRAMSPYGRGPPPEDMYNRDTSPRPPPVGEYAAYSVSDRRSSLPRAESPPPLPGLDSPGPVGQAIEMDANTGSPSKAPPGFGQFGPLRDSDGDVAGMVGLQQQRQNLAENRDTYVSDGSRYSSDVAYVPPRQQWTTEGGRSSPLNPSAQAPPAELPTTAGPTHKRVDSGDNYYEDVDPRFAEQPSSHPSMMPAALAPDYTKNGPSGGLRIQPGGLDGNNSYEDIQSGSRSPAESERSNFTSVSQRGINPRWNPGQPYAPMPQRRPAPQRDDILLNSNPDFQLPSGRGGRGGGRGGRMPGQIPGGGMIPGSAYPTGAL
ncbi:SUR7/PalI family-domain-containing protein [Bisporella sp. PMI_857]|nr:SUR7/PalI family-domain-containing protein [Bisporella sp. PMI_857]